MRKEKKFEKGMMIVGAITVALLLVCGIGLAVCHAQWGFAHEAKIASVLGIVGGVIFAIGLYATLALSSTGPVRALSAVCAVSGLLFAIALAYRIWPLYELVGAGLSIFLSPAMAVFLLSQRSVYRRQRELDEEYARAVQAEQKYRSHLRRVK